MQRQLMARAVVATAFLALAVLLAFEFTFANGRASQGKPAVLSVQQALAQLRAQQSGPPIAALALPIAQASPVSLDQAKARYALTVQALDTAWTALAPAVTDQLTRPQRVWIWRRNAGCEARAPAPEGAARESQRLACRGAANLARAAWLKQYAPPAPSEAATTAAVPAATPLADEALVPSAACAWLRARGDHLGETISFQGEYVNDHSGPALVRPIGCDQAIVLREMDPAARMMLDRVDPPPWTGQPRRFVALFTGRLVHTGVTATDDDAIRLHVAEVTNVRVVAGR